MGDSVGVTNAVGAGVGGVGEPQEGGMNLTKTLE